jgi:hypothetical protein
MTDIAPESSPDPHPLAVPEPEPEYAYGGFTVSIVPIAGTERRWRVTSEDEYFGQLATADPVKGEPGIHFASHFPGEEDIPPTTVDEDWMKAVLFLIDAKD